MTKQQKILEGALFAIAGGALGGAVEAFANGETDPKKIRAVAMAGAGTILVGLLRQWKDDLFRTEITSEQSTRTTPTTTSTTETVTTVLTPVAEPPTPTNEPNKP